MAPATSERAGSFTINSGSNSKRSPSPSQCGQAPRGLLKENDRGIGSGTLISQCGQASFFENKWSASPITLTMTAPPPSWAAFSTAWRRRFSIPGLNITRSTTTSMSWRCWRTSLGALWISTTRPSIRTRTKPLRARRSSSALNSPLRLRTIGPRICNREPSGKAVT